MKEQYLNLLISFWIIIQAIIAYHNFDTWGIILLVFLWIPIIIQNIIVNHIWNKQELNEGLNQ